MSVLVSSSKKRGTRADVFRKMFEGADKVELYGAPVRSIAYLQTTYPEKLYPFVSAERFVLKFLSKMPGKGFGSIFPHVLYSTGRKLWLEVLNGNPDAVRKIILTSGTFYKSSPGIYLPLSEKLADKFIREGVADNVFRQAKMYPIVKDLLDGSKYISYLLTPGAPEMAVSRAKLQIEKMLAGLSGLDIGAAKAVLSTIPALVGPLALVGIVGLFRGVEIKKIAEKAIKDGEEAAAKWNSQYQTILKIPQAASVDEATKNDILNRARLYSLLDMYGIDLERYLGLPTMAAYYDVIVHGGIAPIISQQSETPASDVLPAEEQVGTTVETHTGPLGITVETESPVTETEQAITETAATPEQVLLETKTTVTDTDKQWLTAAAVGGGILIKVLGLL